MVVLARALLVGLFAVAGTAKLADRDGVRRMVVEFGSPASLASPLTWTLACCELGVAVALLLGPSSRVGALAAVLLLIGFSAAVVVSLSRGRRPECHCFGRLHASRIGWSTVVRNALLATVGGFAAADGRFPIVFAALAVIAAGVWLSLELRQPRGLQPGRSAPVLSLADHEGRTWALESLLTEGRPLLLVFSDPACTACRELIPEVARWQDRHAEQLSVALVSAGSSVDHVRDLEEHGLSGLLVDEDRSVAAAYGISATPSAVLVDAERRIAATPAVGADEIGGLVTRIVAHGADSAFERRALLTRAATGVAAVTVMPFISSAAATARSVHRAVRPKRLEIDGAWLCNQRYALCTSAACEPSSTNPNISVCRCKVSSGYSVGFKSCERRAPKGRQLHSNFSLQDVTSSTRVMTCSQRGLWVQCLDVVCQVERDNPRHARCQCVNMETTDFLTFGGNCDTETCESVIWSATTAPFPGGAQYETGLKRLGIPVTVPKSCPASTD
jgi:peroxiredoxin